MQRQQAAHQRQLTLLDARLRRAAPANRLRQQQQRLDRLDLQLRRILESRLGRERQRLAAATRQLHLLSPQTHLQQLGQQLQRLDGRLHQAARTAIERPRARLEAGMRQLNAVSPLATMQRGYSVLRDPATQRVITQVAQVSAGDSVQVLLVDGRLDVVVQKVSPDERSG